MKEILFILISFISIKTFSQSHNLTLKATIEDSLNNPIYAANISLLNIRDSTFVTGASSNELGEFILKNLQPIDYILKISHISYRTKFVDLKIDKENNLESRKYVLSAPSTVIDEINITNKNNIFIKQNDRTTINIKESTVYTNQTDLIEMLRKLPGIWIDQNNNILFNGQQKVLVTINNKAQYLSNADLIQRIKSIPTNTIDKIEIIDNPGAKYDAQGVVILNITTDFKVKHGLSMSINSLFGSSMGYGEIFPKTRNGFNISRGGDRLNININYNFTYNESLRKIGEKIDFKNSFLNQSIYVRNQPDRNHSFNLGVDYEINKKNSLSIFYTFSDNTEKIKQNNSISYLISNNNALNTISNANEKLTSNQNAINFNYHLQINEKSKIDYSSDLIWADKVQKSSYINQREGESDELLNNNSFSDVFVLANQLDYSNTFKKGSIINAGIKTSKIDTENDIDFSTLLNGSLIDDPTKSNKFKYNEKIYAGYLEWNREWEKLQFLFGMRYEKSDISGKSPITNFSFNRSIDGFFPNVTIGYNANDNWNFSILFNRKISRPNYKDINPFIYYLNPYTQLEGNPGILPSITNKVQSNLTFKQQYSLKLTFYKTNDVFTTAQFQDITTGEQKLIPTNIGDLINYDLNIGIPASYKTLWEGYFDITLMHQKYKEKKETNLGFESIKQTTLQLFNQNTFKLGKNYSIDFTNTFLSPSLKGQFRFSTIYFASIGVNKMFLENKLNCSLTFNDVFRTFKIKGQLAGPGWRSNYSDYNDSQQLSLSLKYDLIKRGKISNKRAKWISEEEKKRL